MNIIQQKITLFFIALAIACSTAQPLLAKPFQRSKKPVTVNERVNSETFRDAVRIGLYTGVVSYGVKCLQEIYTLRQDPVESCIGLLCHAFWIKLFLTLAADNKTNREGILSRWIKRDGALAHILVGGMQLGFGTLFSLGAPGLFIRGCSQVDRFGGVEAANMILLSIGYFALGVTNCISGAKKIRKSFSIGAD